MSRPARWKPHRGDITIFLTTHYMDEARDQPRIITALLQPMLYLFVLGSGLGSAVPRACGVDLCMSMVPDVMAMAVLFTCFFTAGSMLWDRKFGFMREMPVAPVNRGAILQFRRAD